MSDPITKSILHLQAATKLLQERKTAQKRIQNDFDPMSKKAWLMMIKFIDDPHYCEALMIQLESRKQQINPDFKSKTRMR